MEIDVRAQHTWVTDTFRYQITVNKGGGTLRNTISISKR